MENFRRDYAKEHFKDLTPREKREALARLSVEEWQQVLAGLSAEKRLAGLSAEERLAGLSAETIEKYLKRRKKDRRSRD
jgi:hypothetical protein